MEELNNQMVNAAHVGNHDLVKKCLLAGANVNALSTSGIWGGICHNGGISALWSASMRGSVETIKLLLDHGADVNQRTSDLIEGGWIKWRGSYPIVIASSEKKLDAVRLLLSSGTDINAKTKYDLTALSEACGGYKESPEIVSLLLSAGANPDGINGNSLFGAVNHYNVSNVELLLCAGADPYKVNYNNETPIDVIKKSKPFSFQELSKRQIIWLLRTQMAWIRRRQAVMYVSIFV